MMDIDPGDFHGRVAGHVTADDPFDRFVETCQFATRASYVNQLFALKCPMIALADTHAVSFMPSVAGPLEQLLDLVREEARARRATWFYIAVPTKVAYHHGSDASERETNIPDGTVGLVPGVYWHAASKVGSYYRRRTGLARFTETDLSPFLDSANSQQPNPMFDRVLP